MKHHNRRVLVKGALVAVFLAGSAASNPLREEGPWIKNQIAKDAPVSHVTEEARNTARNQALLENGLYGAVTLFFLGAAAASGLSSIGSLHRKEKHAPFAAQAKQQYELHRDYLERHYPEVDLKRDYPELDVSMKI